MAETIEREIARLATCPEPELRQPRLREMAEMVASLYDHDRISFSDYNWLMSRIHIAH